MSASLSKNRYFFGTHPPEAFARIVNLPAGAIVAVDQRPDEWVRARVSIGSRDECWVLERREDGKIYLGVLVSRTDNRKGIMWPYLLVEEIIHIVYLLATPLRLAFNRLHDDWQDYRTMLDNYHNR